MARGVRFTKPERELIRGWAYDFIKGQPLKESWRRTAESIGAKLDTAEAPQVPKAKGLPVRDAIDGFRDGLGNRLLALDSYSTGWYAKVSNRLSLLGLTKEDCTTIARNAGQEWKGRIKVDSLVNNAERFLVVHETAFNGDCAPADEWLM